jgi:hypothetical protein
LLSSWRDHNFKYLTQNNHGIYRIIRTSKTKAVYRFSVFQPEQIALGTLKKPEESLKKIALASRQT